jgi:hypothetical protein
MRLGAPQLLARVADAILLVPKVVIYRRLTASVDTIRDLM